MGGFKCGDMSVDLRAQPVRNCWQHAKEVIRITGGYDLEILVQRPAGVELQGLNRIN